MPGSEGVCPGHRACARVWNPGQTDLNTSACPFCFSPGRSVCFPALLTVSSMGMGVRDGGWEVGDGEWGGRRPICSSCMGWSA